MFMPLWQRIAYILLTVVAGTSCRTTRVESRPPIVQPGAPGESSRVIAPHEAVDLSRVQYTAADVQFMQGMISHHAQEIEMMQDWLRARRQEVPNVHAHHAHGATLMPGMLTAEEMGRLAEASGTGFDRLFLEFMIKHHQGALVMVEDLLSQPGAAQESEIFAFTSDVNAGQSMEIDRMGAMLVMLKEPPQ